MRYPRAWKGQRNMYGLEADPRTGMFGLAVYAEQPGGQVRRIETTLDLAHAEALARRLIELLARVKAEGRPWLPYVPEVLTAIDPAIAKAEGRS